MLKARLKKDFVDERTTRLNQREESVQVSLVCIVTKPITLPLLEA
jgi:hypothetical protein